MYNYSQGYTVGGGMGNIGAYGGLIGGINSLMDGISPDQQEQATPQNSMFGGPQMGQAMPPNPMIGGFVGNILQQNPLQSFGLAGQLVQGLGGFQGTAGGNVGGLTQDQYPARNSGFLNKRVS